MGWSLTAQPKHWAPALMTEFVKDTHQLGKSFNLLALQIRSPTRMSKTRRISAWGGGKAGRA